MANLFETLLVGNKIERRKASELAREKFDAQQKAEERKNRQEDIKFSQAQFDRLVEIGKNPNLTDAGRSAIRQKLRATPQGKELIELGQQGNINQAQQLGQQAVPSLFDSLASGRFNVNNLTEGIQQADASLQQVADKPVNLFDFTDKKDTEAKIKASRLNELSPDDQKKVLFPALTPDARKEAFKRLPPDIQEKVVMGSGKNVINVSVDTGKFDELEKTVTSGLQDEVIKIDDDIETIDDLVANFEDSFLTVPGKLRAGGAALLEKFNVPPSATESALKKFGVVDKADKDFLARRTKFLLPAFTVLNKKIKEITGAAVREGEEGRLGQSTVDPTKDSPTQFRAKAATIREIMVRQRKEKAILLKRGLEYNKENVESIALDNVDSIYQKEVIGEPLSPVDDAKLKLNNVKASTAKGNATIQNAPSIKTQPQTDADKFQLADIIATLPAGTIQPFLTSHRQSVQVMQKLLEQELMEMSDVPEFLKRIKGMSDDEAVANIQKMMSGGQ